MSIEDWEAMRELRKERDDLKARLEADAELSWSLKAENERLKARLAEAEGALRVIAHTDYRGNRSTESMAAQCYFDAARAGEGK